MTTFTKYKNYKRTETIWLGEIPQHWDIKKNKFLLTEKKNAVGRNSSDFTLLSLTLQGVIPRNMDNPQGKFPAEFNSYKIVEPNNLILALPDFPWRPLLLSHI
jgi:type I restriction enzyme, S subunit